MRYTYIILNPPAPGPHVRTIPPDWMTDPESLAHLSERLKLSGILKRDWQVVLDTPTQVIAINLDFPIGNQGTFGSSTELRGPVALVAIDE